MPRFCAKNDCDKRAGYGCFESTIYCLDHSIGEIIKFDNANGLNIHKMCEKRYCKELAEYNYKLVNTEANINDNLLDASFCKDHINLSIRNYRTKSFKKCSGINCSNKAEFGPEESSACICVNCNNLLKSLCTHSNVEIIKLPTIAEFQLCFENKCKNVGMFGTKISNTPCLCEDHANGVMLDINNKNKICIDDTCKTRASYGFDGDKMIYCKEHKAEEMIDLNARKCEIDGCNVQPVYAFENERAIRCNKHKEENMIDVRSVFCEVEDCKIRASFGYESSERCSKHKEDGMLLTYKTLLCDDGNCLKCCCYGFEGEKASKCYDHKEENMINVRSERCGDCDLIASFGYSDTRKREKCRTHKLDNMIQLSMQYCKLCNESTLNPKYRPYCYTCFAKLNPNHIKVIEYKTKENAFTIKLKELYQEARLDKKIVGGVSSHRPDFLLFRNNYCIIVEIDERQHCRYDIYTEESELYRMRKIQESIQMPLYIIRLNPDNYRIQNNLVKGCFYHDKDKKLTLKEEEYQIRLNKLLETVNNYINISIDELPIDKDYLEEIYLFYNE